MTSARQNLIRKFQSRTYRESFVSSHLSNNIAAQISSMRIGRNLSQGELAQRADMKQSRISLMESPSYEGFSINTLKRLAAAFDVALVVRFVPYGDVLGWAVNLSEDQLNPVSFDEDPAFRPLRVEQREGSALSAIGTPQQPEERAIKRSRGGIDFLPNVPPRDNMMPLPFRQAMSARRPYLQ